MSVYLSQLSHSIDPLKRGTVDRLPAPCGRFVWPVALGGSNPRGPTFRLKTYTSLTSDFAKDKLATEGVGANALA